MNGLEPGGSTNLICRWFTDLLFTDRSIRMQTLHAIAGVAIAHVKRREKTFENKNAPELTIRPTPCPEEYLDFLSDPEPVPVVE